MEMRAGNKMDKKCNEPEVASEEGGGGTVDR